MSELNKVLDEVKNIDIFDDPLDMNDSQAVKNVSVGAKNNIVKKSALRKVQYSTLQEIAESLRMTFGPYGSNSLILTGSDAQTLVANYSKDGHKCLKHILYNNPIELSIQTQLIDIVSHVDKEVGDGTTSATLLSSEIFKNLCSIESGKFKDYHYISPYQLSRDFQTAVKMIQDQIYKHQRDFTLDDVYNIALISTNGNTKIAEDLYQIYKEYGLDVYIETAISNTEDSQIKVFDGLTLDEGYSDAAYINTMDGKSYIRDAHVYAFQDPIDTIEMVALFEKIVYDNIMNPVWNDECEDDPVPTVIIAPKISRDMSEMIGKIVNALYSYDSQGFVTQKPPILIVTNLLGGDPNRYLDISRLCGCKLIHKYIDSKLQAEDIKKGIAPTPETIHEFAGWCELVEADVSSTKFVNPKDMYTGEFDKEGNPIPTITFKNMISFLESELADMKKNNVDVTEIHKIKKRIQSLKANMVEFEIGGITIADRDAIKDLVEDAVKSCMSAAKDGVGYAANFEGLRATLELLNNDDLDDNIKALLYLIANAYVSIQTKLYENDPNLISYNIEKGCPYNLRSEDWDGKVITSIETDIKILDAISRIITLMVTTEQCYVQVPALNHYTLM